MQVRDDAGVHRASPDPSRPPRKAPMGGSLSGRATAVAASKMVAPLMLPADRALALDELSRTALEHLAHPDLLRRLLGRLRQVLNADNAAILLTSDDPSFLTIYSVEGPEAVVAGQVRVPVGEGVAGTIVATQAPVQIDDLTRVPVANPFLREHLRSLVGVPLVVHGRAIGALHVDSVQIAHFGAGDVPFVQAVAERIALAVDHARLYQVAQTAHQKAEACSRQLAAIFAAMTDAVYVMDRAGRVLQMNAAARDLLGLAESDTYVGRALDERRVRSTVFDTQGHPLPLDRWPHTRIMAGEVLNGSEAADIVVHTADGRMVELSITSAPIRDEHGAIVASVNICCDVTERRRLERRTREALDTLLRMAQILVALPAGLSNDQAGDRSESGDGVAVPATLTMPVEVPTTPPAPPPAPSSGKPADFTAEERQLAHQLAVLAADVLGCVRVSITAVESATERLRAIAVAGLAPEQEATWWNEQRQSEARGARLGDGADADELARFRAGKSFVLDMTHPPYDLLPNPYGITTVLIAPMRAGGALVGMLALDYGGPPHAFTADEIALAEAVAQLGAVVLERDRLLRARARAEARVLALQETQRAMDSFLGIAGHELKTPLTTAVATSQLARRRLRSLAEIVRQLDAETAAVLDPLVSALAHFVERIGGASERQTRLVNDLLDVSRIRAGQLDLTIGPLDLCQLVTGAVEEQRLHHPKRAITLHLPRQRVWVQADADRISQAVTNLLTNALKYSRADMPVDVQVRIQVDAAQVRVRDLGPGIARDEQPSVWERFHRVPGVEVLCGSGVGLGLGLYITREIIERHEGRVGLTSAPGKGSTFWFSLPLAAA